MVLQMTQPYLEKGGKVDYYFVEIGYHGSLNPWLYMAFGLYI